MSNVLSRYGVPLPDGRQQIKQPKTKHRFRILFWGFGRGKDGEFVSLETNSVDLPNVNYTSEEVHSYNSKSYYKGKYTWGTQSLVVRDTIDNTVLRAVANQMQKEFDHYRQIQQTSAADYKFEMWIQSLDGSDTSGLFDGTLHTWVCEGCITQDYNFDTADYSGSDVMTVSMTVQPDNCYMLDSNGEPLAQGVVENSGGSDYLSPTSDYGSIGSLDFDDSVDNNGRTFFGG